MGEDTRVFQILHCFGKDGVYFAPVNAQELSEYSNEELQPYVDAGCLLITGGDE